MLSSKPGMILALAALTLLVGLGGLASADHADPEVHSLAPVDEDKGTSIPAGVPTTLGWVLTNGDGEPAFHQDARFEVRLDDQLLVVIPPASGHDYDGIDPYRISFPHPGNFTVHATVHDGSTGEMVEREMVLEGTVVPAPSEPIQLELDVPETVAAGELAEVRALATDGEGQPVEHVDIDIHVQRVFDRFEVFATRIHEHPADGEDSEGPEGDGGGDDDPAALPRTSEANPGAMVRFAFDRTGTFEITATATPVPGEGHSEDGQPRRLAPASVSETIEVEQAAAGPTLLSAPTEQPLTNERQAGSQEGDYELFGTYDPYTSVGPHGRLQLGMLTLDADTHAPVDAVDYEATITDDHGRTVFASTSLHAADGFAFVTVSRPIVGDYAMHVQATKGDWHEEVTMPFSVLPPAAATNSGALHASPNASGQLTELTAGEPVRLPVHVEDAAGVPLMHGEVDVRLVDEDSGVPLFAGKLHSHENGTLPIELTPQEGDLRLELLPQSLQPAPTPYTFGEEAGQPPVFEASAQAEQATEGASIEANEREESDEVPSPGTALAIAAMTLMALAGRRRD